MPPGGNDIRADWTAGPAKWAAVAVLGSASIFGMVLSATSRERVATLDPSPRTGILAAADVDARADGQPAAPGRSAGIDLNNATAAELELLPGVGPTLAARIVQDRDANGPYQSVDDLDRVKGIGPGIIAKLRGVARVGP